jgi:hypothetical protein
MFAARSCRRHSSVCAAATFRYAVSSALLDCREICEGEELEALSRASVSATSRILTSVAGFLWTAPRARRQHCVPAEEDEVLSLRSFLQKGDDYHITCGRVQTLKSSPFPSVRLLPR